MDGEGDRGEGSGRGTPTLFKFTLVMVVVGVLASFAVPYVRVAMERSRVAEAVYYLSAVRAAQESYRTDNGRYADGLAKLHLGLELPANFSVSAMRMGDTGDFTSSWRLMLTRIGPTSFGEYVVAFTDAGFDARRSSIDEESSIDSILVPEPSRSARASRPHLMNSPPAERVAASESDGDAQGLPANCESAGRPRCDGHCPQGQACVIEKDNCICVPTPKACGELASRPLCYGLCPPGEVCRDAGGVCECAG